MALLFMDGFDHYVTADLLRKWDSQGTGSSVDIAIQTATPRSGTGNLRLLNNSGTSNVHWVSKSIPQSTTVIVGFGLKQVVANANDELLRLYGPAGGILFRYQIDASGYLTAVRGTTVLGTASTPLVLNTWHYVEFKTVISDTVGVAAIQLDGGSVLSLTGQDTNNTAEAGVTSIRLGSRRTGGTGNATFDFDDVYVADGTGTLNTDFIGNVKVETIRPTGPGGSTQFAPSTGSNWAAVDDTTPNTTDYVTSSAANQVDTYETGNLSGTGTVFGVQTLAYATKTDAGSQKIASVIRSGATDYAGAGQTLAVSSWLYRWTMWETNPATSSQWTTADVDGAEFGVKSLNS